VSQAADSDSLHSIIQSADVQPPNPAFIWEVVVSGDRLAALSLASEAAAAGLRRILVLSPSDPQVYPDNLKAPGVTVRYETVAHRIRQSPGPLLAIETSTGPLAARTVVLGLPDPPPNRRTPRISVDPSVSARAYTHPAQIEGPPGDVVVIGEGDQPVEWTLDLLAAGAKVVVCIHHTEFGRMSFLARRTLRRLEAQRRITVFWNARPTKVYNLAGYPTVSFDSRQTPDLQFDQVLISGPDSSAAQLLGSSGVEVESGALPIHLLVNKQDEEMPLDGVVTLPAHQAWDNLRSRHYPSLPPSRRSPTPVPAGQRLFNLEERYYNATITWFRRVNPDLWILRVRPDQRDSPLVPGQYATLGLGYWEPRVDGAKDRMANYERLVRRSYSISSRIFDAQGYLTDPAYEEQLEFYVVLVPPNVDRLPALTPRLALKHEGDRIYLGPRMAGRYTLSGVTDPFGDVLFLATGTGEAPHNAMVVELFRRGHQGRIVSVVSVRHATDLGYVARHRALEERFPNYRYLPLVTRQDAPGTLKMRIQQLIAEDRLTEETGLELDPSRLQVFMCGNPMMIGVPEWLNEQPVFSETLGVAQLLDDRGFTLPRRGVKSNVYYEEYW
jgi:ferredoxin--NADP+ reductase